ncbi:MAG: hypothetical protein ACLFUS_07070 [Candidatus Sumerlaeia bacterium]
MFVVSPVRGVAEDGILHCTWSIPLQTTALTGLTTNLYDSD